MVKIVENSEIPPPPTQLDVSDVKPGDTFTKLNTKLDYHRVVERVEHEKAWFTNGKWVTLLDLVNPEKYHYTG